MFPLASQYGMLIGSLTCVPSCYSTHAHTSPEQIWQPREHRERRQFKNYTSSYAVADSREWDAMGVRSESAGITKVRIYEHHVCLCTMLIITIVVFRKTADDVSGSQSEPTQVPRVMATRVLPPGRWRCSQPTAPPVQDYRDLYSSGHSQSMHKVIAACAAPA